MVVVTDRALAALGKLRAAEHARAEQAVGLVSEALGGLGLVLDVPGPTDRVFSVRGEPVLFVEAALLKRLAGRVLDHGGPPGQERFTLERIPAAPASDAAAGSSRSLPG